MATKMNDNLLSTVESPVTDSVVSDASSSEQGVFDTQAISILQSVFSFTGQESYDATFTSLANGLGNREAVPEDGCAKTAQVKFMITRQDEAGLRTLGYGQAAIDKLTPQEAHDILLAGTKAEPREEV
jgi:hypothetical protein